MKKLNRNLSLVEKKWLYRAFKEPIIRYGDENQEIVEKPNTFFLEQIPDLKVVGQCECGCESVYFNTTLDHNSCVGSILDLYEEKESLNIFILADVVTGKLTGIEAI